MEQLLNILNRPVFSFGEDVEITVLQLLADLLLIVLGLWFARWLDKRLSGVLAQRKTDPNAVQLLRRSFYVAIIAVLAMTTLALLKIPLTAFAFISGAVAIGIGFGAQNIINNFISGWILMWERPIRIGDLLEIGGMHGIVEAINTRSTRVKRFDGVRLLVPNSHLLENMVVNWTIVDKQVRSFVRVGVQYGSDVQKVRSLLEEILAANSDILTTPSPIIIFEDFGDSALIFDAYFWIERSSERSPRDVRSAVRFSIDEVFKNHDIVIAFPQRDVHIDGFVQVKRPEKQP